MSKKGMKKKTHHNRIWIQGNKLVSEITLSSEQTKLLCTNKDKVDCVMRMSSSSHQIKDNKSVMTRELLSFQSTGSQCEQLLDSHLWLINSWLPRQITEFKMKTKKFDKNKCSRRIIAQFDGANGEHVTLFAHHAFSWYIMRSVNGETSVLLLPREEARKEYIRLKKVL